MISHLEVMQIELLERFQEDTPGAPHCPDYGQARHLTKAKVTFLLFPPKAKVTFLLSRERRY